MARVSVVVNGRHYDLGCDDGQEDHLRRLAMHVDDRIGEVVAAVGQVGEARLLLMASLLLADEVVEARRGSAAVPPPSEAAVDALAEAGDERLGAEIDGLARRIERVAERLVRS